ncbi:hypothetical protein [Roseinatronobacter bogoriensis]|uniref:DUF2946 domain-containing protein n=1 Tax=Roseinatronobacter bogoriensis subsp. barguzinensis TaxID=441209 RepID=A0A2K8KK97_9RHOB|nr:MULTISPECIES: hypothetical protein [Rhodobaca]ATX67478.1 hypothetical protein BG454_18035 [Rhodobaca barguzinensis]MBB4207067.1 hypothetical protein [Rhodobaca bogoriensis DSM 18756]TDW36002.1 hypothetical protein LY39_02979 [Rhodobaca barguzinensis]TDY74015.1 hypothetical protein EV660_10146 [Rhodobaca bogoriensis DSM 18756]
MLRCAFPFLSALLALGFAVSAFAQGYVQVKAPAPDVHELVICGETGLETIFVDESGELIDPDTCPDTLCQDCLRVTAALSSSIVTTRAHEITSALAGAPRISRALPVIFRMAHQPRAPPLLKQA